jgi:cell division protein FtsB
MTLPATQPATASAPAARRVVGVVIIVLIGLCLLFVAGYVQRLAEKEAVAAEIAALEQQIAEAQVRNAVLTQELATVNDDAHVAAIARNALNLVQEGDQLITLIDAPAVAAVQPAASSARAPVSTRPNWQRWLDLIFPAP